MLKDVYKVEFEVRSPQFNQIAVKTSGLIGKKQKTTKT